MNVTNWWKSYMEGKGLKLVSDAGLDQSVQEQWVYQFYSDQIIHVLWLKRIWKDYKEYLL